jgi:hypothetical protein
MIIHTFHQICTLHLTLHRYNSLHFTPHFSTPLWLVYTQKNQGRSEFVGGDMNLGPPEYEANVLRFPSRSPVNAKAILVWTLSLRTLNIRNCVRAICIIFMLIKFPSSLEQKLSFRPAPPITHVNVQTWIFSCQSSNLYYKTHAQHMLTYSAVNKFASERKHWKIGGNSSLKLMGVNMPRRNKSGSTRWLGFTSYFETFPWWCTGENCSLLPEDLSQAEQSNKWHYFQHTLSFLLPYLLHGAETFLRT